MSKCLFVTFGVPGPSMSGNRMRTHYLLRALATSQRVSLLAQSEFPEEQEQIGSLASFCERVEIVPRSAHRMGARRIASALVHSFKGWSLAADQYYSAELQTRVRGLLKQENFDFIQIEHSQLAPLIKSIAPSAMPVKLLDLHNVSSAQYRSFLTAQVSLRGRAVQWGKWKMMQRSETRHARQFDQLLTVSELDAARMRTRAPKTPITVIPNGVDTHALQPLAPNDGAPVLLFVGTLGYQPNIDAVHYFANAILPRILTEIPEARFLIVGNHPVTSILKLREHPHITVTGTVTDVQPYYAQAAVNVVPLRSGGGTRLKILEAMALGRAVVSTTIGCEGLNVQPDQELLVTDTPESFSRAVIELLQSPERRSALAEQARRRVVASYDWQQIGSKLLNLYDSLTRTVK